MSPFRFEDARQERVYRLLLQLGPGPAALYKDACVLRSQAAPLEATSHLVNHLLREANSGIRDVIEAAVHVSTPLPPKRSIENRNIVVIGILARELGFEQDSGIPELWLRVGSFAEVTHRDKLAPPRPVNPEARRAWDDYDALLDTILPRFIERFAGAFYPLMAELARRERPTSEDVKTFLGHVPQNPVTLEYFCQRATSGWLVPLRDNGFFKHPQPVERDEETDTVSYIWWPPSRYLARIAGEPNVAREVTDTILGLPPTDNFRVYVDCAEAALKLPPAMTAELVPEFHAWLEVTDSHLLPSMLGNLMVYLARGGEIASALEVERALLRLLPTSEPLLLGEGTRTDVRSRFDPWEYGEIVREQVPPLIEAAGLAGLDSLCRVLEEAARHLQIEQDGKVRPQSSLYWLDAIGGHERFHGMRGEEKRALVEAVRDGAVSLLMPGAVTVPEVVEALARYQNGIFTRLTLYLLREHGENHREMVARYLLDHGLFESREAGDDYRQLLHERFALLDASERATILTWIQEGPPPGWVEAIFRNWDGREPTAEEEQDYIRRWQRDRLALIKEYLEGDFLALYGELVHEFGEPTEPAPGPSARWVGTESPLTDGEIDALSMKELASFFRTWTPDPSPFAPDDEGLAAALRRAVARKPAQFADSAELFVDVAPIYVSALFWGWFDARRDASTWSWKHMLALATWVIEQRDDSSVVDSRGWAWARRSVIALLAVVLREVPNAVPIDERDALWAAIRPSTDDPDPSPETEARYLTGKSDLHSLALNSTRSEAVRAAIFFAWWVRNHARPVLEEGQSEFLGLESLLEVKQTLEAHLVPAGESSVAVRTVYGETLPFLATMDTAWTASHLDEILPCGENETEIWRAVWDAYVTFNPPYDVAFDLLHSHYQLAIDRLSNDIPQPPAADHLAAHLMLLYWRGKLRRGEPDQILESFFIQAPVELRERALSEVGRWLLNEDEPPSPDVIERLRQLLDWRLETAEKMPALSDLQELQAFGWWFEGHSFDEDWALGRLARVLRVTRTVDREEGVVERLAGFAPEHSWEAAHCLLLIVRAQLPHSWRIESWKQGARAVIEAALESGDSDAARDAKAAANLLVNDGHTDFLDLIHSNE